VGPQQAWRGRAIFSVATSTTSGATWSARARRATTTSSALRRRMRCSRSSPPRQVEVGGIARRAVLLPSAPRVGV
jgi:hypothetical protein